MKVKQTGKRSYQKVDVRIGWTLSSMNHSSVIETEIFALRQLTDKSC